MRGSFFAFRSRVRPRADRVFSSSCIYVICACMVGIISGIGGWVLSSGDGCVNAVVMYWGGGAAFVDGENFWKCL